MSPIADPGARRFEILRAVAGGAHTLTAILPYSWYEHIGNVRTICRDLVRAGHLRTWMARKKRDARSVSRWAHGPTAAHFTITPAGEAWLAEYEQRRSERDSRSIAN